MLKDLLRTVTRPVGFLLARVSESAAAARLGASGVVELRLDKGVKHPLVLLRHVEDAARSSSVRALLLEIESLDWGWATVQEWREGLHRIKQRGCHVVCYCVSPGNRELYLASVATRIVVPPMGEVQAVGVGGRLRFIGPLLQRLGLRFDVEAAGAYKNLGETFTREYPSSENREAIGELLDDLHQEMVGGIAEARGLTPQRVQELVDASPMSADDAHEAGLIDAVGYDDALEGLLQELLGEEPNRVPYRGIEMLLRASRTLDDFLSPDPVIAVLHLRGPITMSRQPTSRTRISPSEALPMLRALREHEDVRAVVLAVDSPGGSVLASDLIWREVQLLNEAKPVIASFGDVSASGGYYISAPVKTIVARPGTMTGSIGVVGGKLVTGKATARLGVFTEAIDRGRNVGMYTPDQPFTDDQRERFKARLEETYASFVGKVASGRSRDPSEIEPLARGRVWSGRRAAELGLGPADTWRRADVIVRPAKSWMMDLIPMAARVFFDGVGLGSLLMGFDKGLGGLPQLAEFVVEHPNEPLALLPAELEVD
jgi:protease-4